jgi:hypothetical protein
VSLPPGGKPVRVVLAVRPIRPGSLQLLGCHCSAWGMEWTQPFQGSKHCKGVPEAPKALKGLEGANGGPVAITVLPALPTIRAALQGAEVQVRVAGGQLPVAAATPAAAFSPCWSGHCTQHRTPLTTRAPSSLSCPRPLPTLTVT